MAGVGTDGERKVKTVLEGEPGEGRQLDLGTAGWMCQGGHEDCGCERWRTGAVDRTDWATVVGESKTEFTGLKKKKKMKPKKKKKKEDEEEV